MIRAALDAPRFEEERQRIVVDEYDQRANGVDDSQLNSGDPLEYLTSAAVLRLFPQVAGRYASKTRQVYRIDKFLGWLHNEPRIMQQKGDADPYETQLVNCLTRHLSHSRGKRDILVFHDTASHFRRVSAELLTDIIKHEFQDEKTWIVWHMYSPLAEGKLWDVLNGNQKWRERTIVVVNMECLRESGMNLPQRTSLEQESELFVDGMRRVERLGKGLANVQKIVAHQHREGVLLYDRDAGLRSTCYYCPLVHAESSSRDVGAMVGYTSILVAAIVRGLAWALLHSRNTEAGLIGGCKQGAVLDHLHFLSGFGEKDDITALAPADLQNPYRRLFAALSRLGEAKWELDGQTYFATALDLTNVKDLRHWTRIEGFIRAASADGGTEQEQTAEKIASEIVRLGLRKVVEDDAKSIVTDDPLPDTPPQAVRCPYEVHGSIKTAYRVEIDGFANIRRIMEKYLSDEHWTSPLSIAVFGQPGSGKGFAIQQILASFNADAARRPLEFNLADMDMPKDLEIAFRKVQDEAVAREVPLVFFDEFDCNDFQWLQYFLAPMQDGKFKAGESTYRIGRAIFVFAGGICRSWNEFYAQQFLEGETAESEPKGPDFKSRKGPDFVSRLRGHLDIQSINPLQERAETRGEGGASEVTGVLMFRRAILLRSLLEVHLPGIIDKNSKEAWIDPDVVRAFLRVPKYHHEVRSMRAIIEMSRLSSRGTFHKSSLPTADQLGMHVDAEAFARLLLARREPFSPVPSSR